MPTYEYECMECGGHFEVFQDMTDDPVATCPSCGGGVRRLIGAGAGFIVRGGHGIDVTRCGKGVPCCGADSPCDSPSCMR